MTTEAELFDKRIDELTRLIGAQLERGSLDEGNATAFDKIIDAWLAEEVARLDEAIVAAAGAATVDRVVAETQRANAEAEREHRRARELSADERWRDITAAHHRLRAAANEAQLARHDARVRATEERLVLAQSQLTTARDLLLTGTTSPGSSVLSPENEGPDGTDDTAIRPDEAKGA